MYEKHVLVPVTRVETSLHDVYLISCSRKHHSCNRRCLSITTIIPIVIITSLQDTTRHVCEQTTTENMTEDLVTY